MKTAEEGYRIKRRLSFQINAGRKTDILNSFFCIILTSTMAADLFAYLEIPFVDKADELMGAVAWGGLIIYFLISQRISKEILQYLSIVVLFLSIGFLGNIFSGITGNIQLILTDGFLFSKPYIIFLFMTIYLTKALATSLLNFMRILAKFFLWILAFCAILSRFIPVFRAYRTGAFAFFSNYIGAVSWWTILFLAIIWSKRKNDKEIIFYMILSGIVIFCNQSGLGMIFWCVGILLYIFVGKKKKVKWYYIAAGCVLCFLLGRNEISEYIFNDISPRALFLKYAFVTANLYLPFGAGFATYGSYAAVRDYSVLYYRYGFNRVYGMSEAYHPYLMDNYYQQIIGQLGYFGFILLIWFMYKIIKKILQINSPDVRNAALLLYGCLMFAGIGFGTASSWGCTVYMLIPVLCLIQTSGREDKINLDINSSSEKQGNLG